MPIVEPPQIHLGDYRRLGPDPEPLGERFDVLMQRERVVRRPRAATQTGNGRHARGAAVR